MRSFCDLSWSLWYGLQRGCRTLRLTVQMAVRVSVKLPFQVFAVSLQYPLQSVLRPKVRGIPLVNLIQLAGQRPLTIALRSAIAILVAGLVPISLQAIEVVIRAPSRVVSLGGRLEGRHDGAIVS